MAQLAPAPVITNEEDAWALLEQALRGQLPPDMVPHVSFRGWPWIEVHLPVTPVDSSITPTMMQAFIELQNAIYRTHTLLTSDTADLRALSKDERDRLELRVRVSAGSNNYVADAAPIFERIGTEIVAKMTPEHLVVVLVAGALILAGTFGWKWWLENRAEMRKAELEDAGRRAQADMLTQHMEAIRHQREHETERLKLLHAAMEIQPVLADVDAVADSAKQQIVRAVGEELGGTVQGAKIDPEFAAEISATRRRQSIDAVWQAVYRVARVDTTAPDGFRVLLTNVETGESLVAALQDALISEDHLRIIQEAVWKKAPVRVRISARRIGQRIADAVVRDVEAVPRPTEAA